MNFDFFSHNSKNKKSAVVLVAKDEGPYLIEWVAYYRILGFDEISVYNNYSTDSSNDILNALDKAGYINHIIWRQSDDESPQVSAYRHAIKNCKAEWIFFIDTDEFLLLHKHSNVNSFLREFDNRPEVGTISCNWRIFGDSGLVTNDGRPVIERFTMAATDDFVVNRHLKSFSRVKMLGPMLHMHVCETTGLQVHPNGEPLIMKDWGLSEFAELSVAQVNHYYTKTAQEYQAKKARGQGGAPESDPERKYWYNQESFIGHNRNDIMDLRIQKDLQRLKKEMQKLKDECHI